MPAGAPLEGDRADLPEAARLRIVGAPPEACQTLLTTGITCVWRRISCFHLRQMQPTADESTLLLDRLHVLPHPRWVAATGPRDPVIGCKDAA